MQKMLLKEWRAKIFKAVTSACNSPNNVDLTTHGSFTHVEEAVVAIVTAMEEVETGMEKTAAVAVAMTTAETNAVMTTAETNVAMMTDVTIAIADARVRALRTVETENAVALDVTAVVAALRARVVARHAAIACRHLVATN